MIQNGAFRLAVRRYFNTGGRFDNRGNRNADSKTGGLYTYLEEVYGEFWGFLCGWVQIIIYGPAIIGALGLYFGSLMANLFGWGSGLSKVIGIIAVLFLCVINIIGTKYGGFVQTLTTIGKLIPIACIIVFGLWKAISTSSQQ